MSAGANVYEVVIQKELNGEFWTNVWYLRANNLAEATDKANTIVNDIERPQHMDSVQFTSYRIRPSGTSNQGTTVPIGLTGVLPSADYLPLFCTLRVDFLVPTGRPSRKYFRLPIAEGDQQNGVLVPSRVAGYVAHFGNYFTAGNAGDLCDVDGQELLDARPIARVAMRQLRRGSKRPVIAP